MQNPNHVTSGFPTTCATCHNTTTWAGATFNHTWFPIYSGTHANVWTTCADCHLDASNYNSFSCTNCHTHNEAATDPHSQKRQGLFLRPDGLLPMPSAGERLSHAADVDALLLRGGGCVAAWGQTQSPDQAPAPARRTVFSVRYVAQSAVYIDAGSAEGIIPGMIVEISRRAAGAAVVDRQAVATAVVTAVATASAVCEIQSKTLDPAKGDEARLSSADEMSRVRADVNQGRRHYLQVLEFTDGDPLEDEIREYVPRPPLEEVNRLRGRIAFERTAIIDHDSAAASSSENGAVIRIDWSRIGGSYWTLTGYWRGSLTSTQSASQTTLLDLMNRTYQIGLFYANPKSPWKFGIGRLILPWAASLGAIDGGYAARKVSRKVTVGMFAGTNPDPTQWNYAPNRQTIGSFVNFETGSYDGVHWSSTAGIAFSRVNWRPERQYLFVENNYSIGRTFSIFQTGAGRLSRPQADERSHRRATQPEFHHAPLHAAASASASTSATTISAAFRRSTRG